MSNPTTPFSWQMPQNTDLVTDLPADFEVFGQAVATSMQDLLGGTTGQVLAKASNADMDFVWSADAAGMTNPMTTTGDVIYSSPGSTPVRLGIGTTGQVMTVAGGVPSWASAAGGLTLISTTTIGNAVASISLPNGTFTGTYNNYRVIFDCSQTTAFSSSGSIRIDFRYRVGGVDMAGAAYNFTGYEATSSLTSINQAGVNQNRLGYALDATPNRFAAIVDLFGIATTAQTMHTVHFSGMDGGTNMSANYGGFEFNPTAYDSMTFILSTGTMTNGRIRVYGYQNS